MSRGFSHKIDVMQVKFLDGNQIYLRYCKNSSEVWSHGLFNGIYFDELFSE